MKLFLLSLILLLAQLNVQGQAILTTSNGVGFGILNEFDGSQLSDNFQTADLGGLKANFAQGNGLLNISFTGITGYDNFYKFVLTANPINIKRNPKLFLRFKPNGFNSNIKFRIDISDINGKISNDDYNQYFYLNTSDNGNFLTREITFQLPAGFDSSKVTQVLFKILNEPTSLYGSLTLDKLILGNAPAISVVNYESTTPVGYLNNFNSTREYYVSDFNQLSYAGVSNFVQTGGVLSITGSKNLYETLFETNFFEPLDITRDSTVAVKLKCGTTNSTFLLQLVDVNGKSTVNNNYTTQGGFMFAVGNTFSTFNLKFEGQSFPANFDTKKIKKIQIRPYSPFSNTYLAIDSLAIGTFKPNNDSEQLTIKSIDLSNLPSAGGLYAITITSNTNWTISNTKPWIQIKNTDLSGYGNSIVNLTVLPNTSSLALIGQISVAGANTNSTKVLNVAINSNEPSFLSILPSAINLPFTAGDFNLTVTSNLAKWTLSVSGNWISPKVIAGTNNQTLHFTYQTNLNVDSRSTNMLLTGADFAQTISVYQDETTDTLLAKNLSVLPKGAIQLNNNAGFFVLTINSNGSFTITTSESWLYTSAILSSGLQEVKFYFSTNTSASDRTGTIIITNIQSGAKKLVTVSQSLLTGIGAEIEMNTISLFPNPSLGSLSILSSEATELIKRVNFLDNLGNAKLETINTQNKDYCHFEGLKSGFYFVEVISNKRTIYFKLIVQ